MRVEQPCAGLAPSTGYCPFRPRLMLPLPQPPVPSPRSQVLVFGLASLLGDGSRGGRGEAEVGASSSSPPLARGDTSPGARAAQGGSTPPGSASFLRLGGGGLLSALSGWSEEAGAGAATLALVPRKLRLPALGESVVSRVACGPRHTVVLTRPSATRARVRECGVCVWMCA